MYPCREFVCNVIDVWHVYIYISARTVEKDISLLGALVIGVSLPGAVGIILM